jgi:hypothetical protein
VSSIDFFHAKSDIEFVENLKLVFKVSRMASDTISDINSYLDSATSSSSKSGIDPNEKGQYFVDQATGQYYYQAADGDTMTVVSAATGHAVPDAGKSFKRCTKLN